MPQSLVASGGNASGHQVALLAAWQELAATPHVELLQLGPWCRSAPSGGPLGQPEFINSAALIETSLTPWQLWDRLQAIERKFGRERGVRWGARTIDLDLLFYDQLILRDSQLTVPHPRWSVRQFVLQPCLAIAPQWRDPVSQRTLASVAAGWQQPLVSVALLGFSAQQMAAWLTTLAPELAQRAISVITAAEPSQHPPQVVFVPDSWYPLPPSDGLPPAWWSIPRVPLQIDPLDELRAALVASDPQACKMSSI